MTIMQFDRCNACGGDFNRDGVGVHANTHVCRCPALTLDDPDDHDCVIGLRPDAVALGLVGDARMGICTDRIGEGEDDFPAV